MQTEAEDQAVEAEAKKTEEQLSLDQRDQKKMLKQIEKIYKNKKNDA